MFCFIDKHEHGEGEGAGEGEGDCADAVAAGATGKGLIVGLGVEDGAAADFRVEKATHSVPPSATTRVASVTVPAALRARSPAMAIGPAA